MKRITKNDITSHDPFTMPEWLLTNGLGGYAYLSVPFIHTKSYHALFNASLHPPVDRYSVLYDMLGCCRIDGQDYDLQDYFDYILIGDVITYVYTLHDIIIKQTISLVHNKNTFVMNYHIFNPSAKTIEFYLRPILSLRIPDQVNEKAPEYAIFPYRNRLSIVPLNRKDTLIHMKISNGVFTQEHQDYTPAPYTFHQKMGGGIQDHLSIPGFFESIITDQQVNISVSCTLEEHIDDPITAIGSEIARKEALTFSKDALFNRLVKAADNFIVKRGDGHSIIAGYPWFTDWGRDTLISLEGLTLVTKRYDDAKDILTTFIETLKDGLCVNMFPDGNGDALYNTADASLWLIHATYQYYQYTHDYAFIKKYFSALQNIIFTYIKGTKHNIHLNDDFLLSAGSGEDQITWMDVRIHGKAVTPRHGCPVELNALWYNALCIMDQFAKLLGEESFFDMLAGKCKESFTKFFDTHKGYLYDVAYEDATMRPNQLYAFALPFPIIDQKQAASMVEKVYEQLYVGKGLRTLPADHPDYHGIYTGVVEKRDLAYHQGTAWGYLIGPFLRADYALYHNKARTALLLKPLLNSLDEQCINGINEIFDADAPHTGKGCVTQAWSVAEVLCIYANILKND